MVVDVMRSTFVIAVGMLLALVVPVQATGTTPSAPWPLMGEWTTKTSMNLTWDYPADNGSSQLEGFVLYRWRDGNELLPVVLPPDRLWFNETHLDPAFHSYWWYVRASNAAGQGDMSNIETAGLISSCNPVMITIAPPPPDAVVRPDCLPPTEWYFAEP